MYKRSADMEEIKKNIKNFYEKNPRLSRTLTGAGLGGALYTLLRGGKTDMAGLAGATGLGGLGGFAAGEISEYRGDEAGKNMAEKFYSSLGEEDKKKYADNVEKFVEDAVRNGLGKQEVSKVVDKLKDEGFGFGDINPVPDVLQEVYKAVPDKDTLLPSLAVGVQQGNKAMSPRSRLFTESQSAVNRSGRVNLGKVNPSTGKSSRMSRFGKSILSRKGTSGTFKGSLARGGWRGGLAGLGTMAVLELLSGVIKASGTPDYGEKLEGWQDYYPEDSE